MTDHVLSVTRTIPAPAADIFALIADPSKHPLIDGSGTVVALKDAQSGPCKLGDTFGMDMKMGAKYSMVNTIIELEPDRRVAWQTHFASSGIAKKLTGRIWRYELEPVEGATKVTESWDLSQDGMGAVLWRLGWLRKKTVNGMAKTLERIEEVLAK